MANSLKDEEISPEPKIEDPMEETVEPVPYAIEHLKVTAGPSGAEPKEKAENIIIQVKPELKAEESSVENAEEQSNQEDANNDDSDYDIKKEVESGASDSDESITSGVENDTMVETSNKIKADSSDDDDDDDDNVPLVDRTGYRKVFVKNYTSDSIEEEPITNSKHIFKKSQLEFEKEKYHQQIFQQIFENAKKISLKELQAQYIDQLRKSAKIEIFSCSLCSYKTINLTNLKLHLLMIHNDKIECEMFKCNKCSYKSNFQSYMTRHLETHIPVKAKKEKHQTKRVKEKFPCTECSYKGRSEDGLKRHMQMHKDNTKCDLCEFESENKNTLKKHKNTHRNGDKFFCYKCDYSHKIKLTLARHLLNVHQIANEASKRSKICEICSHSFSNIHQLRRHYITHKDLSQMTEGEIFKCHICNHQTKYKANFKLHMLVHKAPDLVCEICGFATRRQKNYDYHLITHKKLDEIEWFRCELCPYQARNRKLLSRHIKRGDHSGKRLVHVRNRDRLREAEEKGEDINVLIRKYRIKKINGVEIKRERIRKPKDPNKKRVRKSRKKQPKQELMDLDSGNDHLIRLSDLHSPSSGGLPQIF